MPMLRSLFSVSIARRVGIWALIQALPDEDALRVYLRAAYLGLAGVIIGSVLTGAAIAVGIVSMFHLLIEAGWDRSVAVATTAGFTLAVIATCFMLAGRWFIQLASIKDDMALLRDFRGKHGGGNIVTEAVHAVTDGFIEGLTTRRAPKQASRPATDITDPKRRIRLIP